MDYELDMAILPHHELIRRAEQMVRLHHGEANGWSPTRHRLLDGDRVLSHCSLVALKGQRLAFSWRHERGLSAI